MADGRYAPGGRESVNCNVKRATGSAVDVDVHRRGLGKRTVTRITPSSEVLKGSDLLLSESAGQLIPLALVIPI